MNRNIKIAMELVRIARELVASQENFGSYSIDFDKNKRTFTVYFILKEDAVESKALKDAKACWDEIKKALSSNELISVTSLENNQKSFSFTIVVYEEKDMMASSDNVIQFRFAAGDEENTESDGEAESDSRDEGGADKGDSDSEKQQDNEDNFDDADTELFDMIEKTVSRICEKHNWEVQK